MNKKIAAVVVTYNRKILLAKCIDALVLQTAQIDRIFIIDNASTDGTDALMKSDRYVNQSNLEYVKLSENVGGAGGFSVGLERAFHWGGNLIWVMDDDAFPDSDALEALLPYACSGVIPVSTKIDRDGTLYGAYSEVIPKFTMCRLAKGFRVFESGAFTFVGPLISSDCIRQIGLPRTDFFIEGDDTEYSLRALAKNFKILCVEASRIDHDSANGYVERKLLGFSSLRSIQPDWKRYYQTRNRAFLVFRYSNNRLKDCFVGLMFLLRVMLGDFLFEPGRAVRRTRHRIRGLVDALSGRFGKRVIPQ